MTTARSTDEQYALVYQGIVAVASHCDGARTLDGVGFNGQDTHFGRRIASVPFAAWTPNVCVEAARIALTYKVQIERYTGIDVSTLQVVRDASTLKTIHEARNDARAYERRAKGADKVALRKIDVVPAKGEVLLGIFYDRKDPDFGALLDVCKALPGRTFDWDRKCNVVPPSGAIEDFVLTWDFPLTPAAQALLATPHYDINLAASGPRVVITSPYDPTLVAEVRQLPGRSWDPAAKVNTADVGPAVLAFAARFHLSVHPDAQAACERAQRVLQATPASALSVDDWAIVSAQVSATGAPEDLPEVFVQRIAALLDGVVL